ncbi:MAG TPA: type IV pilus modification protein PilV [Rubrivivax sp.]|nr:type IV pilus modification protein PilV [Rubrivivax sp.]
MKQVHGRGGARRKQRGVGLIEVLVSVVVAGIGLLGAAALQASALRNNQGAYERTQTTILTQDIFDAMRANLAGVITGAYNSGGWVCSAPTNASLASSDVGRWIVNLQRQINSSACGQIACTAARDCTVQVRWDDSRATDGDSAQTLALRAQL